MYSLAKKRILIIDDDQEILDWFKTIQRPESPFVFYMIDNEYNVLSALGEVDPDLVFIDICLNSLSGKKVGEVIKAASYFKIPIVYMSSKKDWSLDNSLNDKNFIPKPLSQKMVKDKIISVLKMNAMPL